VTHPVARRSRRRPRRADEVTLRIRIELSDVHPPIWRVIELSSAVHLDGVHQVVQRAFAWNDSHLHRFAVGTSVWDNDAELYLCPFDVREGEDEGIPEQDVRLDEVLVEEGDTLHYSYDYGDGWDHVLRLEAILDRGSDQVLAVCIDGRRAGPPDDCGGPGGYQELVSAGAVDAEHFNVEEINASLSGGADGSEAEGTEADGTEVFAPGTDPIALFLQLVQGLPVEHELAKLVADAKLTSPVLISTEQASSMVRRYAWLLERVGDTGVKLSAAGYLPAADVTAAMVELEMTDEWYGKFNRESQTLPVLELRQSAQRMGLLRKHRGRLLLTREAQKLRGDPVMLWWHIARRLPLHASRSVEHLAGLVFLLGVAAGRDIDANTFKALIGDVLFSVGWRTADGAAIDPWSSARTARDTMRVLAHLGALGERHPIRSATLPTSGAAALARAALQRAP
jgi:hypothetical protein